MKIENFLCKNCRVAIVSLHQIVVLSSLLRFENFCKRFTGKCGLFLAHSNSQTVGMAPLYIIILSPELASVCFRYPKSLHYYKAVIFEGHKVLC